MPRRPSTLFLMASLLLLLCGGPADASEMFDNSSPNDGQVLDQNPFKVVVRFSEQVRFDAAEMADAAGKPIPLQWGKPEEEVLEMELHLPRDLGAGTYTVHWTTWVTTHFHSDDGYIRFTIKPAPKP